MTTENPHPETPQPASSQPATPQYFGPTQYGPPFYHYPPTPPPPARRPRRARQTLVGVGAAALAAGLVFAGVAIGHATEDSGSVASGVTGGSSSTGGSSASGGSGASGGTAQGYAPSTGNGATSSGSTTATAKQQVGIVTVDSVLKYQNAESAGTGMILTSDGEILTNNHVVDGATSITVTVETTGKSYRATVVGTDATDDVAVLKLANASGLATAKIGDAADVAGLSTGDTVTGVGNAGGTGTLTVATGKVTALNQTITATDETGADSETLDGLIETDAPIISGDSGGPLYDSDGDIVGINTAASTSGSMAGAVQGASVASQAYAIPITDALSIAKQIEAGIETSSIRIGLPAFLGVGLADTEASSGAAVGSVVTGGPADDAGITAGSVITKVGGTSVSSATSLQKVLDGYDPGDRVSLTWTDTAGQSHTATVTLATGPAA